MIQEAINPFKEILTDLDFVTKIGGAVTTISRKTESGIKRFPVYINGNPSTCTADDYIDFIPDDSQLGTIYFEDNGSSVEHKLKRRMQMVTRVRMIGFFNLKKLGIMDTSILVANVLGKMPKLPISGAIAKNIRYRFTGEQPKTDALFNRYTYNEAEKQYLIYPFGYFGLDFQIDWDLPLECADILELPNPAIIC